MRTVALLTAFGAAAASFNDFAPHLELYANAQCNTSAIVLDGNLGCSAQSIGGQTIYIQSTGCNFDNNQFGVSFCQDSQCTSCVSLDAATSTAVFDACSGMSVGTSSFGYKASCSATPCCQTTAIVVCFAVFLSLGAAGLCVFWAWMDRVHKRKAAEDAKAMAASVEEETRKAQAVAGGGIFGGGASSGTYSAL